MPAFRTPRLAALIAATAAFSAAATVGSATPASAATKAAAPKLSIESKTCAIGATEEERSVTVTALALLGDAGDRVTMRFSLQSRQAKAKWKSVLFKDPTITKTWETTDALRAGLKLTKTIPSLPEGFQYRVVVESRGVDSAGKVVTKTAKKYVLCNQPLFTPTLVLGKVQVLRKAPADGPAVDGPALVVPVKNLGRLASEDVVLTIADAATRTVFGLIGSGPLKGGGSTRWVGGLPADCTQLYITVQEKGADPTQLTADQAATVDCTVAQESRAGQSRRR